MTGHTFIHYSDFQKPEEYLRAIVDMSLVLKEIGACNYSIGRALHGLDITRGNLLDLDMEEEKYDKMKKLLSYV